MLSQDINFVQDLEWTLPQLKYLMVLHEELHEARQQIIELNKTVEVVMGELVRKSIVSSQHKPSLLETIKQKMLEQTSKQQQHQSPPHEVTPVVSRRKRRKSRRHLDLPVSKGVDSFPDQVEQQPIQQHQKLPTQQHQQLTKSMTLDEGDQSDHPSTHDCKTPVVSRRANKRRRKTTPVVTASTPNSPSSNDSAVTTIATDQCSPNPIASYSVPRPALKKIRKDEQTEEEDLNSEEQVTLSDKVVTLLSSLHSVTVQKPLKQRIYANYPRPIPTAIQSFNDIQWNISENQYFICDVTSDDPSKNMAFHSLHFCETVFNDWEEFEYMVENDDVCVIGMGNEALLTHLNPVRHRDLSDFDVWILRPYLDNRVDGPFHISTILANMKLVDCEPQISDFDGEENSKEEEQVQQNSSVDEYDDEDEEEDDVISFNRCF